MKASLHTNEFLGKRYPHLSCYTLKRHKENKMNFKINFCIQNIFVEVLRGRKKLLTLTLKNGSQQSLSGGISYFLFHFVFSILDIFCCLSITDLDLATISNVCTTSLPRAPNIVLSVWLVKAIFRSTLVCLCKRFCHLVYYIFLLLAL